jgi:protocatechuate 3,4-dioxygenase beta subunit
MKRTLCVLLLAAAPCVQAAIRGTVFSGRGEAVGKARVSVYRRETVEDERARIVSAQKREPLATATTDAEGAFAIDAKLDGVFDLRVEHDGYAPWREIVLADDRETAVELTPAALRTGHVTAGGKPVAGALLVADDEHGSIWSARSDEKGAFSIPEPKGWARVLRVMHSAYAPLSFSPMISNRSLELALLPGTEVRGRVIGSDRRPVANARLVVAAWPAGTTREDGSFSIAHLAKDVTRVSAFSDSEHGSARRAGTAELEIKLEPGHSISGTVRDAKGRPLAGARLMAFLDSKSWDDVRIAISDEKGNYRLGFCDASRYQVMADAADLDFELAQANLRAVRTTRLDFTAAARSYLEGTVVNERKQPVAGARVQLLPPMMPIIYANLAGEFLTSVATTTRDGRFRIAIADAAQPMMPQFRVVALHPRYAATVVNAPEGKSIALVLRDGIEVHGTVTDKDGNAVAGAAAVVMQDPFGTTAFPIDALIAAGMGRAFADSDAEGKFTLHLNEKPHDLTVSKEGFAAFRLAGLTPAAGQKPIAVVLERGVEIRGRVTAKKSGIAPEGTVVAQSDTGTYATVMLQSDGSFSIGSLAPGDYTLRYTSESGKSAEKRVKAPAADVVIELPAAGEIRGRVVDKATNAGVPQFTVMVTSANAADRNDYKEYEDVETFTQSASAGPVEIQVSALGYITETQQVTIDLEKPASVTFALTRGRTISGRVANESGLPIGDASISVAGNDYESRLSVESDGDGEFELAGAPREPVTISVSKEGYVARQIEIEGDADRRINVVLPTGRTVSGRVVTATNEPVAGADIWAHSAAGDGSMHNAKSSADGTFTLAGLSEGRYSFRAMRSDLGEAELNDVDPSAAPLVLVFPPSKGVGSIHGTVKGYADRAWMYGAVWAEGGARAIIGRDGTYRLENVRAGETELRAQAMSQRDQVSSAPVKVNVIPDQDIEVNLAFRTDIVVRGTVTEGGQPASGRDVTFMSQTGSSRTKTDERGAYELSGLEPGLYSVFVMTSLREQFSTRYQVAQSATFDIAIAFVQLQGRVVDETGAPQAGVEIEVKSGEHEDASTARSDNAGAFAVTVTDAPAYVVTATRKGFATAVARVEDARTPVVLRLVRSAGLRVRLTDARDGKTLKGFVVATNEARLLAGRAQEPEKDGTFAVPVGPGAYRVSASASGYATQSVRATVPFEGELRMALTPGGTLVVQTETASSDLVKLVMPTGEEYVRCECNGIAEIRLTGTKTVIEHVAPGRYTLQVLDIQGHIKTSYPISIAEGQTTVAEIHVPE